MKKTISISIEQIKKIVNVSRRAPSGDNCQPWTFDWDGTYLSIFCNSSRDRHPLNPSGIASLISLGSLLEAIELAANEIGFESSSVLGNITEQPKNFWARVKFEFTQKKSHHLFEAISYRTTDRRIYQGGELTLTLLSNVEGEELKNNKIHLHILPRPRSKIKMLVSRCEQLIFDHDEILPATLNWARLSITQAVRTQDGMHWKNMGINFGEIPLVFILRKMPKLLMLVRPFLKLQNLFLLKRKLESSAGFVCVSVTDMNAETIVDSGRLAMRAWLSLNKNGFGVQPLSICSLVIQYAKNNLIELPSTWKDLFVETEALLRSEFHLESNQIPLWIFRTGISSPLPEQDRTFRIAVDQILNIRV